MAEWKPTVCIYHGGCNDGFTAAWAVWKRWGDAVRYVPMGYGDALPALTEEDDVLMVDFSLKTAGMVDLWKKSRSFVVLDHHKTAENELEQWNVDQYVDAPAMTPSAVADYFASDLGDCGIAFFDMEKSGARLAWEFCFPGVEVPRLIDLVEDRDLWRFKFEDTKPIHRYLAALEKTFTVWNEHAEANTYLWRGMLMQGNALLADHMANCAAMLKNAHYKHIGGHRCITVNVPYWMASDVGHMLLQKDANTPFSATYFARGDGSIQYSLRSEDSRVDVSEIARKYGGGGHRNAAGFQVPA